MPPIETDARFQKAVLWQMSGVDDYGEPRIDYTEELSVRWEDRRTQMPDPLGNMITVDATAVVDKRIEMESLVWKGEVDNLPGTSFTAELDELMVVVAYTEVPDVKGRFYRRTVGLKKYRDTLATQA
jgi:hypothetical protein